MKSDTTTHLLLGVIATGVAALTAIAFEKRYCDSLSCCANDIGEEADDAIDTVQRKSGQAGRAIMSGARNLKDRVTDAAEDLADKAGHLKDRLSDGLEEVGDHLKDGAAHLAKGFKEGAHEVKSEASKAATDLNKAAQTPLT